MSDYLLGNLNASKEIQHFTVEIVKIPSSRREEIETFFPARIENYGGKDWCEYHCEGKKPRNHMLFISTKISNFQANFLNFLLDQMKRR